MNFFNKKNLGKLDDNLGLKKNRWKSRIKKMDKKCFKIWIQIADKCEIEQNFFF